MNPLSLSGMSLAQMYDPKARKAAKRKQKIAEYMAKGHTRARATQLAKQH